MHKKSEYVPLILDGVKFQIAVEEGMKHEDFIVRIAEMFSVIPYFITLKQQNEEWHLGDAINEPLKLVFGDRGGMHRTVSTTLRWDEGSGSTDSSPVARYEARPRSSRSRSRSQQNRMQRAVDAELATFHSTAVPPSPPPAQRDTVMRMARDRQGLVGHVFANPEASVEDVIRDMNNELSLAQSPWPEPQDAATWSDVDYIHLHEQPPLNRGVVTDLRYTSWERYQEPRLLPVLFEGAVDTYLVIPESDTIRDAQNRVNAWNRSWRLRQVIALDCHHWVVHTVILPDMYINALNQCVDEGNFRRGGARRQSLQYPDEHSSVILPVQIPEVEETKTIFTVMAHDPDQVRAYWITKQARLWHLLMQVEKETGRRGVFKISTLKFPIHVTARLWHLPGGLFVIHDEEKEQSEPYHCFFPVELNACSRWSEATLSQQAWPPERGGTRAHRTSDQRAQMIIWAMDRVVEHYPYIPTCTAQMLLRAEARTVSALLNARSGSQVVEVMEASMRRAGLHREWFAQADVTVAMNNLMQQVNSGGTQPQHSEHMVVLLLSLQNQLAGQWQAINALNSSLVQLRQTIATHQPNQLQQGDSPGVEAEQEQDNQGMYTPTEPYSQPNFEEERTLGDQLAMETLGQPQAQTQEVGTLLSTQGPQEQPQPQPFNEQHNTAEITVSDEDEEEQQPSDQPNPQTANDDQPAALVDEGMREQTLYSRLEARANRAREPNPNALQPFRSRH